MKTADFDYDLPEDLIAQNPAPRRDEARLLVYYRATDTVEHRLVRDLPDYVGPDWVLAFNETRVVPARFYARKSSGGLAEFLLLNRLPGEACRFAALGKAGRGLRAETTLDARGITVTIAAKTDDGQLIVEFASDADAQCVIDERGVMPLPPYIRRKPDEDEAQRRFDRERYQTVFAREPGAVAAPTAGLHFTDELFASLSERGAGRVNVTLHVGVGTFAPVKADDITDHVMHEERYTVSPESAAALNDAKAAGKRILAVGTTVCRTLESATRDGRVVPGSGSTRLFIAPGYQFRFIDALMTNFHLPRSTLLMLVSALIGREKLLDLYAVAVREHYRFFSYGDAMVIL